MVCGGEGRGGEEIGDWEEEGGGWMSGGTGGRKQTDRHREQREREKERNGLARRFGDLVHSTDKVQKSKRPLFFLPFPGSSLA